MERGMALHKREQQLQSTREAQKKNVKIKMDTYSS